MTSTPVATQIADLMAWARRLSDTRHRHDTAEHAAFQAAKTDLLARLNATHPPRED
jgi:hypothetical protein